MVDARTRYTRHHGVNIAYRVLGSGDVDLLWYSGAPLLPMECIEDEPHYARFLDGLASFTRLIQFDARGIGLSDPTAPSEPPTLEQWADDAIAVLDAVGCHDVAVLAPRDAGLAAVMLATRHPERVARLILINGFARTRRGDDYAFGIPDRLVDGFLASNIDPTLQVEETPTDPFLSYAAPSVAGDAEFRRWWERSGRQGASPATAQAILTIGLNTDVRPLLELVRAPTLVLQNRDTVMYRADHGRYLAEHIPGARYVELPGVDTFFWAGDTTAMLDEIEGFLGARRAPTLDRTLATVVFTDIVKSTESLADVGDRRWRELLDRHDALARREIERNKGRLVKSTGDGALAVFDGPARAVACACAIRDGAAQLGLGIRSGVHTGEIERRGDDVAGMAVHIAARVESLAQAGEVLVSRTVADLVVGSGLEFEDRGAHELKGVPGTWQLFAVVR